MSSPSVTSGHASGAGTDAGAVLDARHDEVEAEPAAGVVPRGREQEVQVEL